MFCGKCGSSIPDGNSFCGKCGAPISNPSIQTSTQPITQPVQVVPITIEPQSMPVKKTNSAAITGFVFGIVGICLCLVPYVGFVCGLIGLVLSIVGITKKKECGKGGGLAVTGLLLSIIGAFIGLCMIVGTMAMSKNNAQSSYNNNRQVNASVDYTAGMDLATSNAFKAGLNYLKFSSFSKKGLINQLSSPYGDNYTEEQARTAVNAIEKNGLVDWKEQAVKSAKNYLSFTSFSRQGLIEQLSSEYGDQFTLEEATYAADQVGLK